MKTNFELLDLIYICHSGRCADLHNNFDFVGYNFDEYKKLLIIKWTRSTGGWVTENEYSIITLEHHNVSYIDIHFDNAIDNNDIVTLGEVTFFPANERDVNDHFLAKKLPGENDDILYVFENDNYIRVGCETILFKTVE